ncbi:MAG TPA: hypothetical protein VJZ73_09330 [Methylomirabilota bacterium]|nr:hypothetical protein [Methylomirabilota bacterium]
MGLLAAATLVLALAADSEGAAVAPWPSVLGARAAFSPEVSAAVQHVWNQPTLSRTVNGPTARVPIQLYTAFIDAPDVTAAAARFRRVASYHIQPLDGDRYRADDGDGARGFSHVLRRDGRRRVILSRGEHTGPILGTISGSALTVLDLATDGDLVQPTLTAYVRIDDGIAASLAQLFIPRFGFLADRKLAEGLHVTKAVAEWAVDPSGGFCEWLAREPLAAASRARVMAAVPACTRYSASDRRTVPQP